MIKILKYTIVLLLVLFILMALVSVLSSIFQMDDNQEGFLTGCLYGIFTYNYINNALIK